MKKLSIEEKAQRYDETIQKLRLFYMDYDTVSGLIDVKEELADRFPELKESSDEEIRKEIIDFIYDKTDTYELREKSNSWLAWLEKQGESIKDNNPTEEYNITGIKSKHAKGKLGEMIKEMKSTDKVEPKFKVGDWVVYNGKHESVYQIEKVENFQYTLRHILGGSMPLSFSHEDMITAWNIRDTKDGDVLQLGKVTAIFKELIDDGVNCRCYCSVYEGEFEIPSQDGIDNSYGCHDATPATKEQRDALEKAMTDAGYTFDFKKKELKKIEQKPAEWHREDEQNLNACLGYIPDEFLRRWLTDAIHVKYDKPAWSEEDEQLIGEVAECLRKYAEKVQGGYSKVYVYGLADRIESLRPQNTCKPNEVQIKTCKEVYADILSAKGFDICTVNNELNRLEGQLKKLTEKL